MADILFMEESYAIPGACFEVYNELGCVFIEQVFQECLQIELTARGIPFVAKSELQLQYKGTPLVQAFEPDFVCYGKIIIEIKAVSR